MDWFRMYGDMPNDPKIGTLSDAEFRTWVELLCYACKAEKGGNTGLTLDTVNWALRRNVTETFQKLLDTNLVCFNEQKEICIVSWTKRQYDSDSSTDRVRRHRAKKAESSKNQDVSESHEEETNETLQERSGNGPEQNRTEQNRVTNPNGLVVASDAADEPSRPGKPACPHQQIIALYHELLPANPAIRDWTDNRAALLRARWNEDAKRQNLDYWKRFFAFIAESEFLTGRKVGKDGRTFTPGLEWIVKPENFSKIREGRYHSKEAA